MSTEQQPLKHYIVRALAVTGIGKAIYKSGDVVTENDFPKGQAEQYLKSRHLKEYTPDEFKEDALKDADITELNAVTLEDVVAPEDETPKEEEAITEDVSTDTEAAPDEFKEDAEDNTPDYSEMTNAQLKTLLDGAGIEYDAKDNKKTLIEKLTAGK